MNPVVEVDNKPCLWNSNIMPMPSNQPAVATTAALIIEAWDNRVLKNSMITVSCIEDD